MQVMRTSGKPHVVPLALLATAVVAAACRGEDAVTNAPVGLDSAQQVAFGARLTLTDSGVARATLVADSALIYEEGLRMDLRRLRLVFVDTAGDSIGSMNAERAIYDVRTSKLVASGAVSVTAPNGRVLQTPQLTYDPLSELLRSDSSYTFTQATPSRQASGQGFETDPRLSQIGRSRPKQ
jgi:LPS export ABC transporter protein LptC